MRSVPAVRAVPAVILFATAALMIASGCGSDTRQVEAPPPSQSQAVSQSANSARAARASMAAPTLDSFKADLTEGKSQIDAALASLNRLTDPKTPASDLRPAYDAYSDQLARITQQAEKIKREADTMRDARSSYFAKWEAKAAEIDNPTIRASAENRKARLRAAHDRITSKSLEARDAYEPLMRDLQDVRKFLAAELSPATASMLGDVSTKASASGANVKQKIDAVIAELDTVTSGSPQ